MDQKNNKYGLLKSGLAVDIDETLSWTIGHLVERMMEKFGNPEDLSVPEIIEKYRYTQNVPYWQEPAALDFVREIISSNELQKELPLIKDADFYLRKINEIIPVVAYLTLRPEAVRKGTKQWLEKHNFPKAPIICQSSDSAPISGSQWKAVVLQDLYPTVVGLIDDNAQLLDFLPAGYQGKVFLYNHHDNFGRPNVVACRNWLMVYKEIKYYFKKVV